MENMMTFAAGFGAGAFAAILYMLAGEIVWCRRHRRCNDEK